MNTSRMQTALERVEGFVDTNRLEPIVLRELSGSYWHCSEQRELSKAEARALCLEGGIKYVDLAKAFRTEDGDTYKPHDYQVKFVEANEPFTAFCAGLGTGKTSTGASKLYKNMLKNPGTKWIVGAPWNRTLKQSTLPALAGVIPAWIVHRPRSPSDCCKIARKDDSGYYEIRLRNGSSAIGLTLEMKSKAYDAISGMNIAGFLLDEGAFSPEPAFQRLVQRMRKIKAFYRQGIIVTTPPTILGWMYDTFERCSPELRAKFGLYRASTRQATHLPPEYLQNLLDTLSKLEISIMVDGNFEVASGVVFALEVSDDIESDSWRDWTYAQDRPVYLGIDFGFRKSAVVFYQPVDASGEDLCLFDEIIREDTSIETLGASVKDRGYRIATLFLDPMISDEQAAEFRRYLGLSHSQVRQIRKGWNQESRVEIFRQRLLDAQGVKRLRFARRLHGRRYSKSIDGIWGALRRYAYPEDRQGRRTRNIPINDGISSHVMTAAQYPTLGLYGDRRQPATFR